MSVVFFINFEQAGFLLELDRTQIYMQMEIIRMLDSRYGCDSFTGIRFGEMSDEFGYELRFNNESDALAFKLLCPAHWMLQDR